MKLDDLRARFARPIEEKRAPKETWQESTLRAFSRNNFEVCEGPHELDDGVTLGERRKAMTSYAWDVKGIDPNRDIFLCDHCHAEYQEHWSSMWADYHASLL